jgi:hypothetical protein
VSWFPTANRHPDRSAPRLGLLASLLNRAGKRTGRGNGWTSSRVCSLRSNHGIASHREGERRDRRKERSSSSCDNRFSGPEIFWSGRQRTRIIFSLLSRSLCDDQSELGQMTARRALIICVRWRSAARHAICASDIRCPDRSPAFVG